MLDWIWGWESKFCLELLYGFGLCVLFITSGTSEFICLFIEITQPEPPQQPDLMHCAKKNSFLTGRTLDRERELRYLKQQEATFFLFVCSLLSSARVYHFLDFGISPFGSSSLASWPVVPCPELGDELAPTNSLLVTARCRNICFYRFHPISSQTSSSASDSDTCAIFSQALPTYTGKTAFFIDILVTQTSYITCWQLSASRLHLAADLWFPRPINSISEDHLCFFMNDTQPRPVRQPAETRLNHAETNSMRPLKPWQPSFTPVRIHSGNKMAY